MKKYPYHQSPFYKCTTKRRLSETLKTDISRIKKMIQKIENTKAYYHFPEKGGRDITSPNAQLKKIQKRINNLLSRIEIPGWVHGGVKGKSVQTNASVHKNSKVFLKLDLKNFFDNCLRERIYQYFHSKLKMSKDTAKIMTDLTTYKNKLATGSPTSTYLSFLAYENMFTQINKLIASKNMLMTLYIDDITISGYGRIKNLSTLTSRIDNILKKYGHRLNNAKTYYGTADNYPVITGVVIDPSGKLKVPNKQRYKIVNSLKKIKSNKKNKLINSTKGRIITAQQTEKNLFSNALKRLNTSILE